jgi:regulator of cell morphogenesis and NO signaling
MTVTATRAPSPEAMSIEDLLAHIEGNYQVPCRRGLPELVELARKVERVHHDVPDAPLGLADALEHVALELDMHMQLEEDVLFRAMRQHIHSVITHPIALMRGEHAEYAAELDRVRELAHGFVPPVTACGSWRRLYQGVEQICETLREQMRIENEVLFPRFEISATRCICAHG